MGWKVLIPHAGSRPRTDACRVAIDAAGTMTIRASSELLSKAGLALGDPVEVSLGTDDNAGWVRLMKAVSGGGWMLSVNGRPTKNPAGIATLKISFTPAHESRFTDTMPSHPVECVITDGKYLDVCWVDGPAVAPLQAQEKISKIRHPAKVDAMIRESANPHAEELPETEDAGHEPPDIGGDTSPIETAEPLPPQLVEQLNTAGRAEFAGDNVRAAAGPTGDRSFDASLGRIRRADPPNPPPPWSPSAEVVPITKPAIAREEEHAAPAIEGAYGKLTADETERFVQAAAAGANDARLVKITHHFYNRKAIAGIRRVLAARIWLAQEHLAEKKANPKVQEPIAETTPETWRELRQIALRVKGAGGVMERVNVAEGPDRMKLNGEEMTPDECLRKANVLVDEWEAVA